MAGRRKNLIFLGICFSLVFLVYGSSLFGGFVLDDRSIVAYEPVLHNVAKFPQVITMGYWSEETGLYRPVTLISYSLNYYFFGPSAAGFHFINLIFYAWSAFLVFLFLKRVFPEKKLVAYLSGLLFLVLPIHSEVVANIVGRAEIFALFFSLLALLEIAKNKPNSWMAASWFFLALGSKESAVAVLPICLWIIIYRFFVREKVSISGKNFLNYFSSAFTLTAALVSYLSVRFFVLGSNFFITNASFVENPLRFVSFSERIATSLKITAMYIKKSFWPAGLCSDYSYNQIPIIKNFLNIETLLGAGIILFFLVGLAVFMKKRPLLSFGSGVFLFSFLPVSNLVFPIGTVAGERLMYFPSLGLCVFLACVFVSLGRVKNRFFPTLALGLFAGLIVCYAVTGAGRAMDWLSEKRLFISAGECAANSVLSRSNLSTVYYFEGDYERAFEENLAANQIYDKYSKAINNLGLIYWKKGEYDKAKQEYFRAIKNWPPYEGVYENLILLELSQGNKEKAEKWARVTGHDIKN